MVVCSPPHAGGAAAVGLRTPGLNTLRTSSGSVHPHSHLGIFFFFLIKRRNPHFFFFKSSNDFQCLLLVADRPKQLEINQKELLGIALVSREPPVKCEDNTEKCVRGLEIWQASSGNTAQVVFHWWFWFS